MEHRHIQTGDVLSTAAIDDIIDRGGRADWAFLKVEKSASASQKRMKNDHREPSPVIKMLR